MSAPSRAETIANTARDVTRIAGLVTAESPQAIEQNGRRHDLFSAPQLRLTT
jgi:hypothetical protein